MPGERSDSHDMPGSVGLNCADGASRAGAPSETEAELTARLESLASDDALAILGSLAGALFPGGAADMRQLTWEATTTPPSFPAAAMSSPSSDRHALDDARLRAAELRYRTLVEQIPAVTFMAVLGEGENEVYVSPHIEVLLGFTQKEWLENPILWYTQLHPDDREMWLAEFARGCHTGGPFRAECRLIARDGRIVWVRGEARLIKDELGRPLFLQGVAFDITESKRAQERVLRQAVRRTEEHYRDLVEGLGAIFWEAEPRSGRFTFVSRGVERILGHSPQRWLDDPEFWLTLVHPDDRERTLAAWRRAIRESQDQDFEFRALTADGRIVWLRNSAHFSADETGPARPLGVILDITERRQVEEQLARMLASEQLARSEAEAARKAAENANRVKDEFLATMSHELRTPVNAVLGWSEILETGAGGDGMQERALAAIKRSARSQAQIIADLLDVSRIVTGKLHLEREWVDLAGVVESALETVKLAADAKQLHVSAALGESPVIVLGDADRLRQVVSNLLTNAVKFTPTGGRIDVRLDVLDALARVQVADSGQGIAPEFLPHVFDRFRQADGSSTRMHGGLGLGLAIVRHLTELHGGRVHAESPGPGRGATFVVELPLHVPVDSRPHEAATSHEPVNGGPDPLIRALAHARVLVVDDDPDSLDVLVAFLSRAGAVVSSASCVVDAMRLLTQGSFDLLVSDIAMPESDGFDLIRQLRAHGGRNARLPAVAVTAYAREEDRHRAITAGYQAHLAKPIDMQEALAVLGRIVASKRAQ